MLASFARRIDLRYRQLCVFAMRYHYEVSKKLSEKNLLTKPRAILDITISRDMIDLANCLEFKSFKIIALKQFPKLVDLTIIRENKRLAFVTNDLGKSRKDKCETPHVQNFEKDRKFLYITHLHDDRDKQFEGITFYFRLKSTYLKFYEMSNDFNSQHHLTRATRELLFSTFRLT